MKLIDRFARKLILLALLWGLSGWVKAQGLPATITVNAGSTITSFIPISIFGNNTAYWISNVDNSNTQGLVQAAGNYFLRYPGGSSSDDYHWNGSGSYNASNYWIPSGSTYIPGFEDDDIFTGTTSSYGIPSNITDGDTSSYWLSNVDTDFPNHQWVELDLTGNTSGNVTQVNAVTLVWGTPFAANFQVQYWVGANGYPPPYMSSPESNWQTIWSGTSGGGTQGVTFNTISAEYLRVLMTSSSAGAAGAYSIDELYVYGPGGQVSSNTETTDSNDQPTQTWAVVSSMDPGNSTNYTPSFDFASYMNYVNSFSPHAIPLITVNFGTGTAQEAASWVYYANKTMGYGIHYWQIGNETEGNWETGGPIPTQDYVRRYMEYYTAMKAVDSSIVITGPVAGGFYDSSNMYDGNSAVQDFISILAAKGAIADLNAIDYHWYPNYGNYTPAQALASTSTLDAFPAALNSWLSTAGVASPSKVPVLMSEYNVDPSDENFQVQLGNGLFLADALGHFITDFGSRGYCNLWDVLNGGSDETNSSGGDLGYLNINSDGYQYQPHATYWAMQMLTNAWAIQGDTNTHHLVSTSITANNAATSLLAAYSDYRPDGVLSLAVVNKDPVNSYNTLLDVGPLPINSSANEWLFNSSNYQWVTTGATPYHASPDNAPTTLVLNNASSSFPVTFQPYSITVLQFTNSNLPTSTFTPTPTITYTPTLTSTPNYGPSTLVDDFENLSRDGVPPERTNLWGGTWYTSFDATSGITVQYGISPGAAGTTYCVKITGNIGAGTSSNPAYSDYYSNLSSDWPPIVYNLSGYGVIGLEFWIYGDGQTYRAMVESQAVTDYNYYGVQITPKAGQWTFYQVPFSSMARQAGWGSQTGLPAVYGGTDAIGVQFTTEFMGKFNIQLDQIGFYTSSGIATPTGTPTYTATHTPTSSPTNSPTLTPTPTGTWFTATPTSTATSTFTSSSTWPPTPSWTATSSSTFTPSFTSTLSPSSTSTPNLNGIFPNPFTGSGDLKLSYQLSTAADQVKIKIFTLSFRKIFEDDNLNTSLGGHTYTLHWGRGDLDAVNGLYYVVLLIKSGGSETHQLIKLLVIQ